MEEGTSTFKYQRSSALYSVQRQISDGNLQVVTVKIPYEDKSTIHVLVDDVQISSGTVQGSPYTWRWDSDTIRISPKVARDSQVLVRRVSPADSIKNIFNGQAEFTDESMDENFKQLLWLAQEYGEGSGLHDVFSNINMHGYKITNVGKATEDDDVVTFGQYREDALGAWQAAQQAKDALQQGKQILDRAQQVADDLQKTNAQITAKWEQTQERIDGAVQTIEDLKQETISEINDAKGEIGSSIQEANNSAQLAKQWAIKTSGTVDGKEYSAKYYSTQAKSQADRAQQIAQGISGVIEVTNQIKIVANNIASINTDATNIGNINLVAGDFNGHTDPVSMPEWGQVGVSRPPIEVPTGGNIYTVAKNMEHVQKDSQNMDFIIKVAQGMDNIPQTVENIKDYAQRAQTAAVKAQGILDQGKASALQELSAKTEQLKADLAQVGTTQAQKIQQASTQVVAQVSAQGSKQIQLITAQGGAYASKAKDWAQKTDGPVQGSMYSAKYWAQHATSGQVQADWAQSNSQQKSFIKNKPTLGALASKDSLSYSELSGVPDLSVYALKTELTNYWKKTDKLPIPDLGQVGVK